MKFKQLKQKVLAERKANELQADAFRKYDDKLHGKTDNVILVGIGAIAFFALFSLVMMGLRPEGSWGQLAAWSIGSILVIGGTWFVWIVKRYMAWIRNGAPK